MEIRTGWEGEEINSRRADDIHTKRRRREEKFA